MRELRPDFRRIFQALNEHGVRYVTIGGVAMSLHGSSHFTDDVDVCYARDRDNLTRMVSALAPYHPQLRVGQETVSFLWDPITLKNGLNFTLATDIGSVDLLGEPPGAPPFEQLWDHALTLEAQGVAVRFAGLDDLLAMKQAAGRPKDKAHIQELLSLQRAAERDGT